MGYYNLDKDDCQNDTISRWSEESITCRLSILRRRIDTLKKENIKLSEIIERIYHENIQMIIAMLLYRSTSDVTINNLKKHNLSKSDVVNDNLDKSRRCKIL